MMVTLQQVHEEFAPRLQHIGHPVIAGGAVRDHLMGRQAKDIDIFVLNNVYNDDSIEDVEDAVHDLPVVEPLTWHLSEPFLVKTVEWEGLDVQLMVNPAESIGDLLDTFDWNVCLFAYDGEFHAKENTANISVGMPLKLVRVTYPMSTLRRGYRFSERFKMRFMREDVISLCKSIIDHDSVVDGHDVPRG